MKKLFSLVLCVALIAMGVTAFAAEKDNYVIGALMKQNADTFVKNISDAIEAHAAELGNVTLDLQDAEGDIIKQLEQAETMLTKGVDAVILLSPSTHHFNKNAIRGGRGAVGRVPIYFCTDDFAMMETLRAHDFRIWGTAFPPKWASGACPGSLP